MGVQLQCAECHNDPFKDWKQADFRGTAAFFRNITWSFNGRYFNSVGEFQPAGAERKPKKNVDNAPYGKITIPKESFKGVGNIHPAKFIGGELIAAEDRQPLRPVFAAWLIDRKNPYFAKAFVNRTWSSFFAKGIVPLTDDLSDDSLASHPALLQKLTDEFIASDLDVRHLVRCIANSQAYQRTSKPGKEKNAETTAAFGRMPIKLMSADMLYDSLRLAMTDPLLDLRAYDAKVAGGFSESSPVGSAYDEFVKVFTINEENAMEFTHGIPQFLTLINHVKLRSGGKTVDDMLKEKMETPAIVEALYPGTLSRKPTPAELSESLEFIAKSAEARKGYNGVLWMLVNRSEFLLVR